MSNFEILKILVQINITVWLVSNMIYTSDSNFHFSIGEGNGIITLTRPNGEKEYYLKSEKLNCNTYEQAVRISNIKAFL